MASIPLPVACQINKVPRSAFARAARPAYALTMGVGIGTMLLLPLWGFVLRGIDYQILAVTAALLLALAWCLRARGFSNVATLLESWTLLAVFCTTMSLLLFVLAATGMPLVDAELAAADRWLLPGIDWVAAMKALVRHPWLIDLANGCYASLCWQPSLFLVACTLDGRSERCWAFLTIWMVVLTVIAVSSVLLPALGPYAYFQLTHAAMPAMSDPTPWVTPDLVTALRDGSFRAIALSDRAGIVTFPSFHAAAAVLFAWSFRPLRWIGVPMVVMNAGMLAATVPIGGHYFIDVIAGIVLAVLAILAVGYLDQLKVLHNSGRDRIDDERRPGCHQLLE